jgi:4-hydroxybenzoate polyprenyltransferase
VRYTEIIRLCKSLIVTLPSPNLPNDAPQDAEAGSFVASSPRRIRPFLQLSRFDRPVGFWLLALPCLAGLSLARMDEGFAPGDAGVAALYVLGAIAMRGAGCTYNDILDRKIDAAVARTARRPLPAGTVSLRAAIAWLVAQCLAGLGVLLLLPEDARPIALLALPLVALYPLMKRITWWPQAWLGLTFNWGVLTAAAGARGQIEASDLLLYAGLALWTLGYDTLYALQDREDDALIGVRSTARRFGGHVRLAVSLIYALSASLCALAGGLAGGWEGAALSLPFAGHLILQIAKLRPEDPHQALRLFRSNRDAGVLLVAGWVFIAALL